MRRSLAAALVLASVTAASASGFKKLGSGSGTAERSAPGSCTATWAPKRAVYPWAAPPMKAGCVKQAYDILEARLGAEVGSFNASELKARGALCDQLAILAGHRQAEVVAQYQAGQDLRYAVFAERLERDWTLFLDACPAPR